MTGHNRANIGALKLVLVWLLEPRAAAPARRLRTIRRLAEAGIPVSVSVAPAIPFVTEPDLERVLAMAHEAAAGGAGGAGGAEEAEGDSACRIIGR